MSPQDSKQPEGTKLVLIALGLALLAVLIAFAWFQNIKSQSVVEPMPVFVLKHDVWPGREVVKDDIEEIDVPKKDFKPAFDKMQYMDPNMRDMKINNHAKWARSADAGTIITTSLFTEQTEKGKYPPPPEGFVQKAIKVNNVIQPGTLQFTDKVRLVVPISATNGLTKPLVVMNLVPLIAMDTIAAGGQPPSYRAVTIEVKETDWQPLEEILAMVNGDIELIRINPGEKGEIGLTKEAGQFLKDRMDKYRPAESTGG